MNVLQAFGIYFPHFISSQKVLNCFKPCGMKCCIVKDRFENWPIGIWAFAGMKWDYLKMVIHFKQEKNPLPSSKIGACSPV